MVGRLVYLIDSNILLELLLDQENAGDVERLLRGVPVASLYISEFSLYSVGIVLLRRGMHEIFVRFVDDLLVSGGIRLVQLSVEDMQSIASKARRFDLDFDDAYQYVAAEKLDLTIVSLDTDFDQTERGRKSPVEIVEG